jgi:hypothetical protein
MAAADDPIRPVIDRWHDVLRGGMTGLEDLLHEDCTFLSPIVFTPQRGRDITMVYLRAAGNTLATPPAEEEGAAEGESRENPFRYVKQVLDGHHAVLEFETVVDGISVNGVDIITCDDDGRIVEFKVMVRPLQAVNKVHEQMKAMLERMQSAG